MALWLALLLSPLFGAVPSQSLSTRGPCLETPIGHVVDAIAPGRGRRPVWMVDVTRGWTSATDPVKTVWVIAKPARRVRITGRHLDTSGVVTFESGGYPVGDAIVIGDAELASVRPGTATPEVMAGYAFLTSQVYYAIPGCYGFDVDVDGNVVHIVREMV